MTDLLLLKLLQSSVQVPTCALETHPAVGLCHSSLIVKHCHELHLLRMTRDRELHPEHSFNDDSVLNKANAITIKTHRRILTHTGSGNGHIRDIPKPAVDLRFV